MVENLKVALIQTDLYWQDRGANLANLEEKIWSMDKAVDLIILPGEEHLTGIETEKDRHRAYFRKNRV